MIRAGDAAQHAEQGEQQRLLPLAVKPAESDDLACADFEGDAVELVLPVQFLHRERGRTAHAFGLRGILRGDIPPDHQLHDLGRRTRALVEGLDVAAVAEDRGSVGEGFDLVHAMGNVEDGGVVRFQPREKGVNLLDVGAGQRRGRLIEDEQLWPLA